MMADSSDSLASQVKVILGEEEVEIPEALLEDVRTEKKKKKKKKKKKSCI